MKSHEIDFAESIQTIEDQVHVFSRKKTIVYLKARPKTPFRFSDPWISLLKSKLVILGDVYTHCTSHSFNPMNYNK